MSGDTRRAPPRVAHRLLVCAALTTVAVVGLASPSFAAIKPSPHIFSHATSFAIPPKSPAGTTWTLELWQHGKLLGCESGATGVLRVSVPSSVQGTVQADVYRNGKWYSGQRIALSGHRGGGGSGSGGSGHGQGGGGSGHGHGGGGSGSGGTGHGQGGGGSGSGRSGSGGSGSGGSGSGGSGSGGSGSGTTPITTIPSVTSASSGGAGNDSGGGGLIGGGLTGLTAPATGTTGGATALPATAAPAAHPPAVPATELNFTAGSGSFVSSTLGGVGLFLLGTYLMLTRRPRRGRRAV